MMSRARGRMISLGRERFQEASCLAESPCACDEHPSRRGTNETLSLHITSQSDDSRRDVDFNESRRGLRPAESARIRSVHPRRPFESSRRSTKDAPRPAEQSARLSAAGRNESRGVVILKPGTYASGASRQFFPSVTLFTSSGDWFSHFYSAGCRATGGGGGSASDTATTANTNATTAMTVRIA